MPIAVIRAADHRAMPWKNGGGETVEIAVSPPGASLEDFDWRVSMATVATDGPFSLFAGIDRTLAVLEGEGLALEIAGREPVTLTPASPPFAFPADAPTSARLLGGPIRDLNLMSRRGRVDHRLDRWVAGRTEFEIPSAADALIFCAAGRVAISDGEMPVELLRRDAAVLPSGRFSVNIAAPGLAFAARLTRRGDKVETGDRRL